MGLAKLKTPECRIDPIHQLSTTVTFTPLETTLAPLEKHFPGQGGMAV